MPEAYHIVSATSSSGATLNIPITWNVDNPTTDLHVVVVPPNGVPVVCDYWTWTAATSTLSIVNSLGYASWTAYVSREENAAMLSALSNTSEADLPAILEQFSKDGRVLEQLQENDKTVLKAPDAMGGLVSTATRRAGKVLEFDANGNPSTILDAQDFRNVKVYKDAALASKNAAAASAANALASKNAAAQSKASALSAAQRSEQARNEAVEITDPEGWLANTRASVTANATAIQTEREKFIPFASVSAMKASTVLKAGSYATTLGYYSANDGGGADYIVVSDATLVDDGGSILAIGSGALRAKLIVKNGLVNVKNFGAKSDYVSDSSFTDSSARFNAAVSFIDSIGRGILFAPAGVYGISDSILISNKCDVRFEGKIIYVSTTTNRDRCAIRVTGGQRKNINLGEVECGESIASSALRVSAKYLADWNASDAFTGVELVNLFYCNVALMAVKRFAVGVKFQGNNGEFNWNKINVRNASDNRINWLITATNGCVNSNAFEGGNVSSSIPSNFSGTYYGIKIDGVSNSCTFENIDVSSPIPAAVPSSATLIHVYLYKAAREIFRSMRWEVYAGTCLQVNCESSTGYSWTVHANYNVFERDKIISGNINPVFINDTRIYLSYRDICTTTASPEFKEKFTYNLNRNFQPTSYDSNGVYGTWRGLPFISNYWAATLDLSAGTRTGVASLKWANSSGGRYTITQWTTPYILFKTSKGASFTVTGNGLFRLILCPFDTNQKRIATNARATADFIQDGATTGSFNAYNWANNAGNGRVTIGENVYDGTVSNGTFTSSDSTVTGTLANIVATSRFNAYFAGGGVSGSACPLMQSNGNVKTFSFSIQSDDVGYVALGFQTSTSVGYAQTFSVKSDTGEFIQYPDKYAHMRGTNEFYSASKPTGAPKTNFMYPTGIKVFDTTVANWGKSWTFTRGADDGDGNPTGTWGDLA